MSRGRPKKLKPINSTALIEKSYKASIKIFGRIYEATGATAREAISNIIIPRARGIGILTLSKGDIKKDKILTAVQTFRLFNGGRIMREVVLKNISALFSNL